MAEKIRLRCSALPLAFRCAGSVRRGTLVIDERNEAADTGTAAHEGLATAVAAGRVDWEGLPELALRHGVYERELRALVAMGAQLWEQLKDSFPNASTEVALSHEEETFVLTGHVDVLGFSAGTAHVGDWKGGRLDKDFAEQLMGYAALVLLTYPDVERATAGIMWIREQDYEHYTMGRHLLAKWLERLRDEVVNWDGTFKPGTHCAHCHRSHECPAANALVRRDVAVIADKALVASVEDEAALAAMAPEAIIDVLLKADLVRKHAERVRDAVRQHVMKHGPLVARGHKLVLQHEERRSLDTWAAFPVLEAAGIEDRDMASIIDVSISKAEELVAQKAGKGKGAAAKRALREALEEAGAVKTGVTTKLVVRRAT